MRKGFLGATVLWLAATGLAWGQMPWVPAPNAFMPPPPPSCDPDGNGFWPTPPPFDNALLDPNCVCPDCPPCCRFYINADYLRWYLKSSPLPPLVTTANETPFLLSGVGILGVPGTTTLIGGRA